MRLLDIDLGNARIVLHHIQCAMTEQGLQREDIAARTQIGDRERVTKPMGMAILHAGFLAEVRDEEPKGASRSSPSSRSAR
jgi:hypothetical protein